MNRKAAENLKKTIKDICDKRDPADVEASEVLDALAKRGGRVKKLREQFRGKADELLKAVDGILRRPEPRDRQADDASEQNGGSGDETVTG